MMKYAFYYKTPEAFSDMVMESDGKKLLSLNFTDYFEELEMAPCFKDTVAWLDDYFAGRKPGKLPEMDYSSVTPFRKEIIERMLQIPYGETVTYGEIAKEVAKKHGIPKMSAQAVGGAVGANPICILVPCHRVLGAGGKLTGYGGGMENKVALLKLEGILSD